MGLAVKDINAAAEKYKTRGAAASTDYVNGTKGAGSRWQSNATAAAESYAQGVQEAIGRGAFEKGIGASGGAYYESRVASLGASRYASGVQAGATNWSDGFKPYQDTLAGLTLSPRGPKGDPRNMTRASEVATALRARKISR